MKAKPGRRRYQAQLRVLEEDWASQMKGLGTRRSLHPTQT
jgi:hypothetical protein